MHGDIFESEASLPVRGAWIEIDYCLYFHIGFLSLPVRGAWIEIALPCGTAWRKRVAPRAGSVD